ncbi:hypothetical protein MN116_008461 [Schistosoma mekongi]|uniref:Uncharacterized protein n=1 Tax=Schistosoma mekongi TaxID=38744 RepID=A0AAE1Z5Y2_SCHME|nr:hypothetical protein MN116_008461 [Schistosoma mekongi]
MLDDIHSSTSGTNEFCINLPINIFVQKNKHSKDSSSILLKFEQVTCMQCCSSTIQTNSSVQDFIPVHTSDSNGSVFTTLNTNSNNADIYHSISQSQSTQPIPVVHLHRELSSQLSPEPQFNETLTPTRLGQIHDIQKRYVTEIRMYLRGSRPVSYVEENYSFIQNFNKPTRERISCVRGIPFKIISKKLQNYSKVKFQENAPLLIKSTPYTVYIGSVSSPQSTAGTKVCSYRKQKSLFNSDKDNVHVAFKEIHFHITKTLVKRCPLSVIINELPVTSSELKSCLPNSDELSVETFNNHVGSNINNSLCIYKKSVGTQFDLFKKYHELKDKEVKITHQDNQSNFQSKVIL